MTSTASTASLGASARAPDALAAKALTFSTSAWFAVTVLGQLIFVAYILLVYGGAVVQGDLVGWNKVMPRGYVAGDTMRNIAIGVHLLLAAVIMFGGALQLIPAVRARAPRFHRWNGRVYITGAVVASLTGLYMVWSRGTVGDLVQHIGTSLNGAATIGCAALAVRFAMARNFAAHRRWAMRLFLCVSGVWFFRVGLMFWIAAHGGPVGFDPNTFKGPFLSFLAYAQFLLPLAVLELYLLTRERASAALHVGMAALLLALTGATAVGVAVATMGLWLPNI